MTSLIVPLVLVILLTTAGADFTRWRASVADTRLGLYRDPVATIRQVCDNPEIQTAWLRCVIMISWRKNGSWQSACSAEGEQPRRYYQLRSQCRNLPWPALETILLR